MDFILIYFSVAFETEGKEDMADPVTYGIGERVRVFLDSQTWKSAGWFPGTVIRVDPYSQHRSFYWVELDRPVIDAWGGLTSRLSVFNLRHIQKEKE